MKLKKTAMKKLIFIFTMLICVVNLNAQITTIKRNEPTTIKEKVKYDSTSNKIEDGVDYIGQELYLEDKPEVLRKYGYSGFVIDYKKGVYDQSNIYKLIDIGSTNSSYKEMVGKYFKIIDVIKTTNKIFLELQEKSTNDIIYYDLSTSWDFLIIGFFQKLKETYIGKSYYFGSNIKRIKNDFYTGNKITSNVNNKWTCVDINVVENIKYGSCVEFILTDTIGQTISLPYGGFTETFCRGVYSELQNKIYKNKFGNDTWKIILEGRIQIGFSKDACEISWGKPKSVNTTIMSGKQLEQWVYPSNYLYFDDDILTTIQEY